MWIMWGSEKCQEAPSISPTLIYQISCHKPRQALESLLVLYKIDHLETPQRIINEPNLFSNLNWFLSINSRLLSSWPTAPDERSYQHYPKPHS